MEERRKVSIAARTHVFSTARMIGDRVPIICRLIGFGMGLFG
jgi:hypothetical protein